MTEKLTWVSFFLVVATALAAGPAQQHTPKSGHGTSSHAKNQQTVDPALAAAAKQFVATGCDPTLWDHVYHPQRLLVVEKCISVTGTIFHVKKEADGDDHIQLKLDTEYEKLLNDRNKAAQADCLVIEPICEHAVTQPDAKAACQDFHSTLEIPAKGAHVKVLGLYVWDTENPGHGWMEIHPVSSISVIP